MKVLRKPLMKVLNFCKLTLSRRYSLNFIKTQRDLILLNTYFLNLRVNIHQSLQCIFTRIVLYYFNINFSIEYSSYFIHFGAEQYCIIFKFKEAIHIFTHKNFFTETHFIVLFIPLKNCYDY